jgi:hypothetical protein
MIINYICTYTAFEGAAIGIVVLNPYLLHYFLWEYPFFIYAHISYNCKRWGTKFSEPPADQTNHAYFSSQPYCITIKCIADRYPLTAAKFMI